MWVAQFADDLDRISREHGFDLVAEYCERLASCVQTYDIVGVKKNLAEFPKIIEQIKNIN